MAKFVATINFTDQGVKQIRDTTKRAEKFKDTASSMSVEIKDIFWTLGAFDGLIIFDAPDEETATALIMKLGSWGNVRTQTARAFAADEIGQILAK